jgi:tRNA(fMet)-specific endonuclease VapC
MICLDSSFVIDYLKGVPEALRVFEQHEEEEFVLTELCVFEVGIGYFSLLSKTKNTEMFLQFIDFASTFTILPMTNLFAFDAAAYYTRLKSTGRTFGITDCLIAGVMNANKVNKIITRDTEHYQRLPHLEVITY